jgi:adenosylcobinamide-GDP ribazoletransferase
VKPFWLALGFLTVLPSPDLGEVSAEDFRRSRTFYPVVGALLGTISVLTAFLLRRTGIASGVEAAILLGAMFLATGFLHLDGLLDCADALLAPVSAKRRLEILKDVHMGAFAFGAGALVLLVFWQLLAQRPTFVQLLCLPILSRTGVLLLMWYWPYARKDGTGILASRPWNEMRDGILTLSVAMLLALPAVFAAPWMALGVAGAQLAFAVFAARRLEGGLTGDCYGAAIVLSEVAGLLASSLLAG